MRRALVSGGCGFIGRHVTSELLENGYEVRILDSLIEQVHGVDAVALNDTVEVIRSDIRDRSAVESALEGVDCVVHLAAEVGVGQSMYEIARYVGANDLGTAVLLEALIKRPSTHSFPEAEFEALYRANVKRRNKWLSQFIPDVAVAAE